MDFVILLWNPNLNSVSLIAERRAIPYTAISTAPTVTLPRIKALTTGTLSLLFILIDLKKD